MNKHVTEKYKGMSFAMASEAVDKKYKDRNIDSLQMRAFEEEMNQLYKYQNVAAMKQRMIDRMTGNTVEGESKFAYGNNPDPVKSAISAAKDWYIGNGTYDPNNELWTTLSNATSVDEVSSIVANYHKNQGDYNPDSNIYSVIKRGSFLDLNPQEAGIQNPYDLETNTQISRSTIDNLNRKLEMDAYYSQKYPDSYAPTAMHPYHLTLERTPILNEYYKNDIIKIKDASTNNEPTNYVEPSATASKPDVENTPTEILSSKIKIDDPNDYTTEPTQTSISTISPFGKSPFADYLEKEKERLIAVERATLLGALDRVNYSKGVNIPVFNTPTESLPVINTTDSQMTRLNAGLPNFDSKAENNLATDNTSIRSEDVIDNSRMIAGIDENGNPVNKSATGIKKERNRFKELLNNPYTPAYAGALANLATNIGILAGGYDRVSPALNPYEQEIRRKVDSMGFNRDAIANRMLGAVNARREGASNLRNEAVRQAVLQGTEADYAAALGQTELDRQAADNQIKNIQASTYNNLGQQRANAEFQAENLEAQNKGVYQSNLSQASAALAENSKYLTTTKLNDIQNKMMLQIINSDPNRKFKISDKYLDAIKSGDRDAFKQSLVDMKLSDVQIEAQLETFDEHYKKNKNGQ